MKLMIIGHDTGDETVVDYCSGETTEEICKEWERVRGDSFIMVANWDVDELQDTLNMLRRATEETLREDFAAIANDPEETTHLHAKAAEADAYARWVASTEFFKTTHETANPDRTTHTLAEWQAIDDAKLVTKHDNPAAGDQLDAVDRTILPAQRDRLSFGEPEVGRLSSRESNLNPEDTDE